jgi:hypothetical protein
MYRSSWLSVINKLIQKTPVVGGTPLAGLAHQLLVVGEFERLTRARHQPLTAPVLTQIPHRATHRIPGYSSCVRDGHCSEIYSPW